MFKKFAKVWLIGILPFFPFQLKIAEVLGLFSNKASMLIRYIDEITIVTFLPFAIVELCRKKNKFNGVYLFLTLPILVFSFLGLISGLANKNSLFITFLGTFDYIKNFLVIFIYAVFLNYRYNFKKIFRILLFTGLLIAIIAFIQECWAVFFHYILGKDIYDKVVYLFRFPLPLSNKPWVFRTFWRFGIYRAPSLLEHPNFVGFYTLLILTLYLYINKKIRPATLFFLLVGIFVSVSRMVYVAFVFLGSLQIFKCRKWFIFPTITFIILLLLMRSLPDSNFSNSSEKEKWIFRMYARNKAIEIWKDHPLLGVGPGMFGGLVSVRFHSSIYKNYNFSQEWLEYMQHSQGVEQFWFQLLPETGIFGTVAFVGLLILLPIIFFMVRQKSNVDEIKGLLMALIIATIFIFIYSFGDSINMAPFIFTYSAFAGIALSHENSSN